MEANTNVVHVIVNNMGGITSLVQNLILYKGDRALPQELLVLDVKGNNNTAAILDPDLESITKQFYIDPIDNWYHVFGKLAKVLSKKKGILVSNDQYDLIMLQAFNIPRKVVQLVHDPYNVQLTLKFHGCIDCFITHSHHIYELLIQHIPDRRGDIFHLPYGIPLSAPFQKVYNQHEPLKVLFLGRHDKRKGIYDLFEISRILKQKNIPAAWSILGKGPETEKLKAQWSNEQHVEFKTPVTAEEVLEEASRHDIMVFPTKFEGFPVALLEAMSMGCVPVVTDLPGGIREVVENGVTGFKCSIDKNDEFADAIEDLHYNRTLLHQMKLSAMELVRKNYDVKNQALLYQDLFVRLVNSSITPRHHQVNKKIGSRLDQSWIPNSFTKVIRRIKPGNHE